MKLDVGSLLRRSCASMGHTQFAEGHMSHHHTNKHFFRKAIHESCCSSNYVSEGLPSVCALDCQVLIL